MASDPASGAIAHWKHGALHDVVEPMADHVIMTYPTGVQRLERRNGKSAAIGTARNGVVTIIPFLGWLLMLILTPVILIWSMAAMVVAVRSVLDYSETFKAVIVVLIGFVVYVVFWMTMAFLGFAAAIVGGMFGR